MSQGIKKTPGLFCQGFLISVLFTCLLYYFIVLNTRIFCLLRAFPLSQTSLYQISIHSYLIRQISRALHISEGEAISRFFATLRMTRATPPQDDRGNDYGLDSRLRGNDSGYAQDDTRITSYNYGSLESSYNSYIL